MRDHATLKLWGAFDALEKRVAALEARQAPVRTPCDFCTRQNGLPVRWVGDDQRACDQCMTELFADQSPPAEKAEARTCEPGCLLDNGHDTPCSDERAHHETGKVRAGVSVKNPALTPCAPAEDGVCESPHECAVSHDEAIEALLALNGAVAVTDKAMADHLPKWGAGIDLLRRYIREREAAEKDADATIAMQAEALRASNDHQNGVIEQLRAEVARLRAAGSAGQGEAAERMPCVVGVPCARHGFVHGAEAEELRAEFEKLTGRGTACGRSVQRVLDRVDARDSLAWLEMKDEIEAATPDETKGGE